MVDFPIHAHPRDCRFTTALARIDCHSSTTPHTRSLLACFYEHGRVLHHEKQRCAAAANKPRRHAKDQHNEGRKPARSCNTQASDEVSVRLAAAVHALRCGGEPLLCRWSALWWGRRRRSRRMGTAVSHRAQGLARLHWLHRLLLATHCRRGMISDSTGGRHDQQQHQPGRRCRR